MAEREWLSRDRLIGTAPMQERASGMERNAHGRNVPSKCVLDRSCMISAFLCASEPFRCASSDRLKSSAAQRSVERKVISGAVGHSPSRSGSEATLQALLCRRAPSGRQGPQPVRFDALSVQTERGHCELTP